MGGCCRIASTFAAAFVALSLLLILYCELIHHYLVQLQCDWPEQLSPAAGAAAAAAADVRLMVISDTHLLGSRRGHWLDRLRREWTMHRSYVSAVALHRPDAVVFLGDLYDEGKWSSDEEFAATAARFDRLFPTGGTLKRLVVAGNHDIGFHYSARSRLWRRFDATHDTAGVALTSLRPDVHLVLVNSVAMQDDGCSLCAAARRQLSHVQELLRCSEVEAVDNRCPPGAERLPVYSRPILLQHYPLHRRSDAACAGADAAPAAERGLPFRPGWECLSSEASHRLLTAVQPRLVLSGHTHHYCETWHADPRGGRLLEYSVPSFSWRNRNNPSYLMVRLDGSSQSVAKCWLAEESTVLALYLAGGPAALVLSFMVAARRPLIRRWNGADGGGGAPRPSPADHKHD